MPMSRKIPAKTIVNAVGAAAGLIVVGWIGSSALQSDEPDICNARYPVSTRLSLTSESDHPVALSELQARLGAGEWGLLDNARVIPAKSGGATPVLAVKIAQDTGAGYKAGQARGGIGFMWRPADIESSGPKSACLSYRIFMPEDMKFSYGGTLPGLVIGSSFDSRGDAIVGSGAAVRPGWAQDGRIMAAIQFATADGWKNPIAFNALDQWPSGRWVNVEQEVILNDVGKRNGVIRLWVDGNLIGETKTIGLRGDEALALSGVASDVHYGNITNPSIAPQDTVIRLSPFVVRWQQ
jgi:hypothetical protein